jgi:hypothetical protein
LLKERSWVQGENDDNREDSDDGYHD